VDITIREASDPPRPATDGMSAPVANGSSNSVDMARDDDPDFDAPPRTAPMERPVARVEPRAPAWTTRASGRRATPSPPTIQVTIGRVEVRAVQPPSPAPAPPPAAEPPALTLDDYLVARDKGSS
jgi:hypothetical protein